MIMCNRPTPSIVRPSGGHDRLSVWQVGGVVGRVRNLLIRVGGGEPLPDGVTFPLERGERVLTWGRGAQGGIAAATDVGLRVRPGDGELTLHEWHEVAHASWAEGQL